MKRNLLLILVCMLALSLSLSGCSSATKATTRYDTPLYSITLENGQYYLTPNANSDDASSSLDSCQGLVFPEFSTVDEMRQAIISGVLPEDPFSNAYLHSISRYSKNADGTIEICDLDNLYECIVPTNSKLQGVVWCGKDYYFSVTCETARGDIMCYDADTYTAEFNKGYKDFLSNPLSTLTGQEGIEDRSATVYYFTTSNNSKLKYICYEVREGDKHLFIQERYCLEAPTPALKVSDTVPQAIEFWGTDDSGYYYGCFLGFAERPSVEWFSQFRLIPYVETSTS